MHNEKNTVLPRFRSPTLPLNDEYRSRVSDLSMRLPPQGINAQALAGLARLLRNTPGADGVWIDRQATMWLRVDSDHAPECTRNLARINAQFAATPDFEIGSETTMVEFVIPGNRLSPRQLYALAALSHVEGAPVIMFSVDGSHAAFVGVPTGRTAALQHGLAEFGLLRSYSFPA